MEHLTTGEGIALAGFLAFVLLVLVATMYFGNKALNR